jgi:hypothetical protein
MLTGISMAGRLKTVGIDRIVQLDWLELTALYCAEGMSPLEINAKLKESIKSGDPTSDAHRKTRTVLMAIWAKPCPRLVDLRNRAIALFKDTSPKDHFCLHWGLAMATYPFFHALVTQTGRLLRLQGNFSVPQLQLRIREQFGERQTVSRAVQRVLRSLHNWKVLEDTADNKGVYHSGSPRDLSAPSLITWLIEAELLAISNGAAEMQALLNAPSLFPFAMKQIGIAQISQSKQLDVIRHGLHENLVCLRKPI